MKTRDTWGDLESAAECRYFDGLLLALGDAARSTGALYLLGYVAEILLKTAYYRVRCLSALDDVAGELRAMDKRAKTLGLAWQGNRHNLESLIALLVVERQVAGSALDPAFATELQARVAAIGAHWSEVLRYKGIVAFESELAEVFTNVEWLFANHTRLWS